MEHGGVPVGTISDMGQPQVASFESGTQEIGDVAGEVSNNSSLVQAHEVEIGQASMSDSHIDDSHEGFGLIEGEEVRFEGKDQKEDQATEQEISEPQMDPDESIKMAKNEGFEAALEYYAKFPASNEDSQKEKVLAESEADDIQEEQDSGEDQEVQIEADQEDEAENMQDENQEMRPIETGQRPELQQIIDVLKGQSEIMKKMIERLEDRQALTEEMLLIMAMTLREALEAKEEKDEDEITLLDTLAHVIGFLMGMIIDPNKESKRFEKNLEKAA